MNLKLKPVTYTLLFSVICINASSAANGQSIEVLTVTASKKTQQLSQTPASLSVIDDELLQSINAQHINQLISQSAGSWISRGNGQEHLTSIRSPVLTGAGGCGAFFMAIDSISLRAPGFCNANQLFDANVEQASQIEILRGPASTLYGANALHGVINILTPDLFSESYSELKLDFGANEFTRTSLAKTFDISDSNNNDNARFGIFTNLTTENGYQAQSGYDQQKATLIYQTQGQDWNNKTVLDIANLNQETAGFVQGFEIYKDETARKENPNPEAFRDAKSLRAYSKFSKAAQDSTISITPYLRWNEMAFLQHFLPWKALEENAHSSAGVQAQYEFERGATQWIVGADIDLTSGELQETQANPFSPNIPAGQHYDYEVDATTFAAFAQGSWQLDKLSIIAGARAERVEYDYNNKLSDGSACADGVEVCRFVRPSDQTVSFSAISPSITFNYAFENGQNVYTKLNQGFRAPQATELFRLQNNQVTAQLDNETMDAIELGWQQQTRSSSLRIAGFIQTKKDVIFQDTNRQNIIGGETSHQGIELEWRYAFNDSLSVATNYAYGEHEYESDFTFSRTSIKGNEIDTAPKHLANARVNWKINDKMVVNAFVSHTSKYFLNPENTAQYDGHTLLDLSLNYQLNQHLKLQANLYNALDTDYAERADFGFGNYRYFVGQPRRVFVSLTWDWS